MHLSTKFLNDRLVVFWPTFSLHLRLSFCLSFPALVKTFGVPARDFRPGDLPDVTWHHSGFEQSRRGPSLPSLAALTHKTSALSLILISDIAREGPS